MKSMNDILKEKNSDSESLLQERTAELMATQGATIHIMAYMAEARENVTGNHIYRTYCYVRTLAEKLRDHPKFSSFLGNDEIFEMLPKTATLHDIGSVGVPDRIFLKPGRLTPEEFDIMKSHTIRVLSFILDAENGLEADILFLKYAKEIVYSHHEKWDGSGYPQGLSGEAIPISARIMAIADVYDALISHRVYKSPMKHDEAVKLITENKGTQFDPDIVDAFIEIHEEFQRISFSYADSDKDLRKRIDYLEQAIAVAP
jgi:putative two-component system response regulator